MNKFIQRVKEEPKKVKSIELPPFLVEQKDIINALKDVAVNPWHVEKTDFPVLSIGIVIHVI